MKNLFNKHKRLGIPWRFILTALLVIAQIIFSILVLYYAESQYFWVKLLISVVWLIILFVAVNRDEPASYKLPWVIVILIFPIPLS